MIPLISHSQEDETTETRSGSTGVGMGGGHDYKSIARRNSFLE